MKFSTIGTIVQGFWYEIPVHFPHIELGAFQVMPNHIHGIIIIDRKNLGIENAEKSTIPKELEIELKQEPIYGNELKNEFFQKISPKAGSLSAVLRSYKSICTLHIHEDFPQKMFEWQERFWDNIIKSDDDFVRITNYILNNPQDWSNDMFYDKDSESKNLMIFIYR